MTCEKCKQPLGSIVAKVFINGAWRTFCKKCAQKV